jgi:hypothetical protein
MRFSIIVHNLPRASVKRNTVVHLGLQYNCKIYCSSYTFVRPLQHTYTASIVILTTSTVTLLSSVDSLLWPLLHSHGLYMTWSGYLQALSCLYVHQSQGLYWQSRDLYMHSHDLYKDSPVIPSINILGLMRYNRIIDSKFIVLKPHNRFIALA